MDRNDAGTEDKRPGPDSCQVLRENQSLRGKLYSSDTCIQKKKKNLSLYPKLAAQFSKTFIRTSINTISDHRHL